MSKDTHTLPNLEGVFQGLDETVTNLRNVGKASQGAVVQLHKGTERLKTLDPAFHYISLLQVTHVCPATPLPLFQCHLHSASKP